MPLRQACWLLVVLQPGSGAFDPVAPAADEGHAPLPDSGKPAYIPFMFPTSPVLNIAMRVQNIGVMESGLRVSDDGKNSAGRYIHQGALLAKRSEAKDPIAKVDDGLAQVANVEPNLLQSSMAQRFDIDPEPSDVHIAESLSLIHI